MSLLHGPYTGVAGLFDDLAPPHRPGNAKGGNHFHMPAVDENRIGVGGRDGVMDSGEVGAAEKLCARGREVGIDCTIHTAQGGHTWQFAAAAFTSSLPWVPARLGLPVPAATWTGHDMVRAAIALCDRGPNHRQVCQSSSSASTSSDRSTLVYTFCTSSLSSSASTSLNTLRAPSASTATETEGWKPDSAES